MKHSFLVILSLLFAVQVTLQAQEGWIWHSSSEGPVFDYTVGPDSPREYYDSGGPEKGMPGNFALTLVQLKTPEAGFHLTIVFEMMNIGAFDEMRIYNGLVTLDNYPDEYGDYYYHWPSDHTPVFETKGTPASVPFKVSSTSEDGCLSVAFQCNSDAPGWKATVYCVKNGDPEPDIDSPDNCNVLFTITDDLGTDEDGYEIEECDFTMMLGGLPGESIAIDCGYGKEDFTFQSDEPATVTKWLDAGATVKIYGTLTLLDLSGNRTVTAVTFGENPNLEVLRLAQNKITELDVNGLTALRELSFTDNKVSDIDISHLENLEEYYGAWNDYKELRTSTNRKLEVLTCYNTGIEALDLQYNVALKSLVAGGNRYNGPVSLANNPNLMTVDLESSNLVSIDLSKQPELKRLNIANNKLESIDLSENQALANIDCRNNLMDACSLNDLLFGLPLSEATGDEQPKVLIAGNPGAADAETDIAGFYGWVVDQTGTGNGCGTVKFKFAGQENGVCSTVVDGVECMPMEPVAKGTLVEVVTTPDAGYKLSQLFFNDEELQENSFEAVCYGTIAAVFVKDTGMTGEEADQLAIRCIPEGFEIEGLLSGSEFVVYSADGLLVGQGSVSPDGVARVCVGRGIYFCKVNDMVVKLMR